jgi:hypothetical protein
MHRLTLSLISLCASLLLACGGGQRLSMLITSEPEGALVTVNDYPRGVTPVSVPYLYIGTYRVEIEQEGYASIESLERIHKPWYNKIPFASLVLDSMPFITPHQVDLHYDLVQLPPEDF